MKTLIVGILLTIGMVVVANFLFGSVIAGGVAVGSLYGLIKAMTGEVAP